MEGHSRSSYKYLLLQVWCGLLTVAMVAMAALLTSIKPKSTEVSPLKPDNVTPPVNAFEAPLKSVGSRISYIQLMKLYNSHSWKESPGCDLCSLELRNDSIYCTKNSFYFIYAQVTFSKPPTKPRPTSSKSVILLRNPAHGLKIKTLVEGIFPQNTQGTVSVGKIVSLREGYSIAINITGDYEKENTFWGAFQLH